MRFVHDKLEADATQQLVRFERGEPACMIVPDPRGLLDELDLHKEPLENNPELAAGYRRWSADRDEFHRQMAAGNRELLERGWQKDYFQGRDPGRERVEDHQTKLTVRPFEQLSRKLDASGSAQDEA